MAWVLCPHRLTLFSPSRLGLINSESHAFLLLEICFLLKPTWFFPLISLPPSLLHVLYFGCMFLSLLLLVWVCPLSPPLRSKFDRWPWLSTKPSAALHAGCKLPPSLVQRLFGTVHKPCSHHRERPICTAFLLALHFPCISSSVLDLRWATEHCEISLLSQGCLMRDMSWPQQA